MLRNCQPIDSNIFNFFYLLLIFYSLFMYFKNKIKTYKDTKAHVEIPLHFSNTKLMICNLTTCKVVLDRLK